MAKSAGLEGILHKCPSIHRAGWLFLSDKIDLKPVTVTREKKVIIDERCNY
jgi:hypothetical protein